LIETYPQFVIASGFDAVEKTELSCG